MQLLFVGPHQQSSLVSDWKKLLIHWLEGWYLEHKLKQLGRSVRFSRLLAYTSMSKIMMSNSFLSAVFSFIKQCYLCDYLLGRGAEQLARLHH